MSDKISEGEGDSAEDNANDDSDDDGDDGADKNKIGGEKEPNNALQQFLARRLHRDKHENQS